MIARIIARQRLKALACYMAMKAVERSLAEIRGLSRGNAA